MLSGTIARHSDLELIVPHGGATLPLIVDRVSAFAMLLRVDPSVDVLRGEDPGNCEARCVTAPSRDAGPDADADAPLPRDTFITIMCPPLPKFVTPSDDERCARALGAYARGDTCLADGGSTSPAPDAAGAADVGAD